MNGELSRAEQEQKAINDARNGLAPDPSGGQYYNNAYNYAKQQLQKPEEQGGG